MDRLPRAMCLPDAPKIGCGILEAPLGRSSDDRPPRARSAVRRLAWWFAVVSALLALLKLWATSCDEIVAVEGPFDQLRFAQMAESLMDHHWLGEYDERTLIRKPAYPIWIWLVSLTGMPLRVAIELLLVAAAWALSAALLAAGVPPWLSLVCQGYVLFLPLSFGMGNQLIADSFYGPVQVLAVAAAIGILTATTVRRRWTCTIGTGVFSAVLWHTRPEHQLVALCVAFLIVLLAFVQRARGTTPSRAARASLILAVPIVLLVGSSSLALRTVAYLRYGVFQSYELFTSGFWASHEALLRIRTGRPRRYVAVPRRAREIAYSVSPAFRRLEASLERDPGIWDGCDTLQVCDDHADGWFLFALRAAAARDGHHRSAPEADGFYRRIAREINEACDDGRIPCKSLPVAHLDRLRDLRYLPSGILRVGRMFGSVGRAPLKDPDVAGTPAAVAGLFDKVANRRGALTSYGTMEVAGWAAGAKEEIARVILDDGAGGTVESSELLPRPGVPAFLRKAGVTNPPDRAGFQFFLRKSTPRPQLPSARLTFVLPSGRSVSVPVSAAPKWNDELRYSLDLRDEKTSLHRWRDGFRAALARAYPGFLMWITLAASAALAALVPYRRRLRLTEDVWPVLLFVAMVIASRLLLFAYVDSTHFHSAPRYLYPVEALYLCAATLLTERVARLALIDLRAAVPRPKGARIAERSSGNASRSRPAEGE